MEVGRHIRHGTIGGALFQGARYAYRHRGAIRGVARWIREGGRLIRQQQGQFQRRFQAISARRSNRESDDKAHEGEFEDGIRSRMRRGSKKYGGRRRGRIGKRRGGSRRNITGAVKRVLSAVTGKQTYISQATGVISNGTSFQSSASDDLGYTALLAYADMAKIFAASPGSTDLTTDTNKMMIHKAKIEVQFYNPGNTHVWVHWYRVKPRRSTGTTNPVLAWASGLAEQGHTTGSGTAPTVGYVGVTPFMSNRFTKEWVVTKVVKYLCEAGNVTKFTHTSRIRNKMCSLNTWQDGQGNAFSAVPGFTEIWFPVAFGSPVGQTNAATAAAISLSANAIYWTAVKTYVTQVFKYDQTKDQLLNGLIFAAPASTIVQEEEEPTTTGQTVDFKV